MVAMAALAFGPTVSRSLGVDAMASGDMHAHCMDAGSGDGMQMSMAMSMSASMPMSQADPNHPADEQAPAHHSTVLDCCALCAIAATPMVVVSFALPPWQPAETARAEPGGRIEAGPRQRLQWSRAAPRGPPSLS